MANRSASLELEEQATEQPPKRGPEHEQLDVFVGKWNVDGENKAGAPVAANAKVTGEETYEWLPGKFFLMYHWDRRFADNEHTGIGVIGYDASREAYSAHFFDNLGYSRKYEASVRDGVLTLTGKWERATLVVGDNGNTMSIYWERSSDGRNWLPLCDLRATKAT